MRGAAHRPAQRWAIARQARVRMRWTRGTRAAQICRTWCNYAGHSILVHGRRACRLPCASHHSLDIGFAWYRAAITEFESATSRVDTAEQRSKRKRVKDLLGRAMTSGDMLMREQNDKDVDRAEKDANTWGEKTHNLIASAYGDGEAALFLDSYGYVFYGDGSPKNNIRNWIDGRMRRITELLRRTDTLAVRNEFDPGKFE